ncbi:MAG: calcium/sodium antiporter [Saprospiraceae bacterium]
MDFLLYLGLFVVSLTVLLKGSDVFVAAAEKIGLSFGISPFIIGVTIVAFGTSLPELASSIVAVLANESEIVVGNVVGSNITNVALVLGIVAIIGGRVKIIKDIMNTDIPLLLVSAVLMWFVLTDGQVSIIEAIILLLGLVIFLIYSFKSGDENDSIEERIVVDWKQYLLMLVGGVLVYFGAEYTIVAISELSAQAGIPPEIIALSLVALGTSLPELVVSIAAARKGNTEMAVGNVLGSNIFNTYAVMSIPRFFGVLVIPVDVLSFSLPLMFGITLLFSVMCLSRTISQWEGWMLVLIYIFFIATLCERVL